MAATSWTAEDSWRCFNPCFRGTCSWCAWWWMGSLSRLSFNPCFRGTCSWWATAEALRQLFVEFQSLFSWNLLLMDTAKFAFTIASNVSILVFVELALDGFMQYNMVCISSCFNPCFRGTCSWWSNGVSKLPSARGFNPCFRGTCSWWPCTLFPVPTSQMFQSLFSWNLLLMSGISGLDHRDIISFNPCFRGTCSWWQRPSAGSSACKGFPMENQKKSNARG